MWFHNLLYERRSRLLEMELWNLAPQPPGSPSCRVGGHRDARPYQSCHLVSQRAGWGSQTLSESHLLHWVFLPLQERAICPELQKNSFKSHVLNSCQRRPFIALKWKLGLLHCRDLNGETELTRLITLPPRSPSLGASTDPSLLLD